MPMRKYVNVNKTFHNDGSVTYFFIDENGDSEMRIYNLFPGVKVIYNSVHTAYSSLGSLRKGNLIEIHHCREGRIEKQNKDSFFYLMPGDLSLSISKRKADNYYFPLNHYHGITISINTDIAPKCFSCFLEDVDVNPLSVAQKLCGTDDCFIIRSKEYIEHIFSEIYDIPTDCKKGYLKIKVMELLLILNGINPQLNSLQNVTLSLTQAELAKKVAFFLSRQTDKQITVSDLSKKFSVSQTHLQNAFKGVYGVPVCSYMRILKMQSAALKLIGTDLSILEIANEYGYDNASKFSSSFRNIMGELPTEYRKAHSHIKNTSKRI